MNIIEQLKANEKPFGLMSEGMQAKAREIGQPEFEMYMKDNTWMRCGVCNNFHCKKVTDQTYRLRDGYAEEPEIVECEIYESVTDELCYRRVNVGKALYKACADPDFIGFKYESGQVEFSPIVFKSDCSTKSICQFRDLAGLEILHATAVLFRRQK